MILWFHFHAKNADAIRKWQLRLSEAACILMVIGPTDLLWDWEKLPFRPNLLLYIAAYALIIIVGIKPQWFENLAFAIENAPTLLRQNLALLSMYAQRHPTNPATNAEPWLRRLSHVVGLSGIATHSLVRAAYIQTVQETPRLGALGIETLSSPDTDLILRYAKSRWDGQQSELSGTAIPIESRILALVLAWVDQLNERELPEAISQLKKEAGKRFDPQLVAQLEQLVADPIRSGGSGFQPDNRGQSANLAGN